MLKGGRCVAYDFEWYGSEEDEPEVVKHYFCGILVFLDHLSDDAVDLGLEHLRLHYASMALVEPGRFYLTVFSQALLYRRAPE